jgi:hypothetical protein
MAAGFGSFCEAEDLRDLRDTGAVMLNPERGFYVQCAAEQAVDFAALYRDGIRLVLLTLDLKRYRDRPLDDAKLERLEVALKAIREAGLKVIFRAAYGFTDADYRVDPADLGLIRRHIGRMAGLLSRHAPVVWAVQAGMLGPWGEWHDSNHGDVPSLEARRAVVETWLEGLPATIFLQVRRPMFLRDLFPRRNDPGLIRTGWHDDALLALPDDMGTFAEPGWDRKRELEWSSAQALKTPFGGETVPVSEGTPAGQVLRELELLKISYLNRGYHPGTLQRWREMESGGRSVFAEVEAKLGHRWAVSRVSPAGTGFELVNTGFAPIYNSRKAEVAWLDPAGMKPAGPVFASDVDLKGAVGKLGIPFKLPAAPEGALLGLRFPDSAESLRGDGRYALRLGGPRIRFDEKSGWNVLAG